KAFEGSEDIDTFYSEIHKSTAMVAAVPILGEGREVCGAILIVQSLKEMDETIKSSISMILFSSLLALVLSALIATWMAKLITDPIKNMQVMAREMTEGNYECKTGIDRKDEIGDMARSIDKLSDRLKENEVERRNLEQMRLDFFANVSHELRTPIAVVRATTECLADGVVTEQSQVIDYHERILRECKSMERLVADLLILSKMQNPNFRIEKEPVNLVHIFDELVRSAAAISQEKNIAIVMNRDKDVYMMMGDYDRLRQMFMVIFDNAIKFSGENSKIYVTLKSGEDGSPMTVSIRDEGIGISKEELPFIFDKFYKSKLRMNAKGTGLGLAIAKNIALKHDGEIKVESEPGKGTEFIFSFHEISEEEYMLSES
ncbi:MAG: HAMP domain-containing protein, partial [Lachnospiraceae bacterium]|nr:HAMP domain-containing protein [Lachnospiraceae bacterium]